jgi:hypothetical protein
LSVLTLEPGRAWQLAWQSRAEAARTCVKPKEVREASQAINHQLLVELTEREAIYLSITVRHLFLTSDFGTMAASKKLGIGNLNRGHYFIILLSSVIFISILDNVWFATKLEQLQINDPLLKTTSSMSTCDAFEKHMQGHWKHKTLMKPNSYDYNMSSYQFDYFQQEVDWLYNTSDEWRTGCKADIYKRDKRGYMYATAIGHQCGCGSTAFDPADSKWIWNRTEDYGGYDTHPSFDLMEKIAKENKTMCFAGDSIDLQFFTALVNNLYRTRLFKSMHGNYDMPDVSVDQRPIPAVYSNETTGPVNYAKYWMCMQNIQEALVTFDYNTDGAIKTSHTARLRYYKVCQPADFALLYPLFILLL